MCTIVLKSGSFNLREPSGPVQAYTGIALPAFTDFFLCRSSVYDLILTIYKTATTEMRAARQQFYTVDCLILIQYKTYTTSTVVC